MATQIITPKFSFIRLAGGGYGSIPDDYDSCEFNGNGFCLPVVQDDDIHFEFILRYPDASAASVACSSDTQQFQIGLVKDCGQGGFDIEYAYAQYEPLKKRISETDVLIQWQHGLPDFDTVIDFSQCFYIRIIADGITYCSNCLQRIHPDCYTSVIEYSSDRNELSFFYTDNGYHNRVRLPFYLSKPQYPVDEDIYTKADGTRVVLKSITTKTVEGETDYMPSQVHERLVVALRHDYVKVEGENYNSKIRLEGEYAIEWPPKDYPFGKASFKAAEDGFVSRGTNCAGDTNIEFNVVDDYVQQVIQEGSNIVIPVIDNDIYCCDSMSFGISSFNQQLLNSASMSADGKLSISVKTPINSSANTFVAYYTFTCDGVTKTGLVLATYQGSLSPLCAAPTNLLINNISKTSFRAAWTAPPAFAGTYYYEVVYDSNNQVIQSNTLPNGTTQIDITGLICGEPYQFRVKAICSPQSESQYLVDYVRMEDCNNPATDLIVKVESFNAPVGADWWWFVRAEIISPNGITANEGIRIYGLLRVVTGTRDTAQPFDITIPAGSLSVGSSTLIVTQDDGTSWVQGVGHQPAAVTCSDLQVRNIYIQ